MSSITGVRGVYALARTLGGSRITALRYCAGYSIEEFGFMLLRTAQWSARRITPKGYQA